MALSRDGSFLYVCIFDAARIAKIDLRRRVVVKTLDFGQGAMRHIILHPTRDVFYASDMHQGRILAIDAKTDALAGQVWVDRSLNTIALSPDGSMLFASSRGPNNPQDYTRRGPAFGRIYRIDPVSLRIQDWTWGGNQPTGLDVAPDGRTIAFSNFLDDTVELYAVDREPTLP
jgi:sugar lactone lactonase YvrE